MIKTDKVIYRTKTLGEYNWLMKKLEESGCEWGSRNLPTEINRWVRYFTETCICLNDKIMTFANFDFYKTELNYKDYDYIEVSDLIEQEDKPKKIKKIVYTTEVYFE